jgi:hypothetical protein
MFQVVLLLSTLSPNDTILVMTKHKCHKCHAMDSRPLLQLYIANSPSLSLFETEVKISLEIEINKEDREGEKSMK